MTEDKFSPTRRSILRLGAMSAIGVGIGIPAVSGSVAATSCPRTPGYWANHPEAWNFREDETRWNPDTKEFNLHGYIFSPDYSKELLTPSKGKKNLIMAKHLMATILNFQNRRKDDPCVDDPIKGTGDTVREVKQMAEHWLENASSNQKSWYVNGYDGEYIKNVLDYWNNNPRKLGLKDCPCYGDD